MSPFWRRKKKEARPAPPPRVAGVVPCAGRSERMGTSKALLDAGGRSFLAAVVGALVGGGCDPVVVVVGPDQEDEARRAKAAGALVLGNPEPGDGPITSLRLALQALGATVEGVAYLPVDHPLVTPETVAALVGTLLSGDAPLVLPTVAGRRGHPALFRRTLFPALLDPTLEEGARTVVQAHLEHAALVEVDDAGAVADIDTPAAYRAAFRAAFRGRGAR
jgi:CTP:molybdopterin cytidylyltransferase MocA